MARKRRRKLRAWEVKRAKYLLVPCDRVAELQVALLGTRCSCHGGVPVYESGEMRCRKVEPTGRIIDGKAEVAVVYEDKDVEKRAIVSANIGSAVPAPAE